MVASNNTNKLSIIFINYEPKIWSNVIHISDPIWFLVAPVVTTPGWNSDGSFLSSASQSGICRTIKRRPEIQLSTLSSFSSSSDNDKNIVTLFWPKAGSKFEGGDQKAAGSRLNCGWKEATPPHNLLRVERRRKRRTNSSALSSLLVWPLLLGIFWQHFWSFCKLWSCSKPFRNCWPDINDFDILLYWCKRWKAFVRQLIHSAYWINHYLCCWPWCSHNVRIKEVSRHVNKQQLLPTSQITFVIHSTNNIVSHFTNNIYNICWSQNQQLCGDSCF